MREVDEMISCNYCALKIIRARARKEKQQVTVLKNSSMGEDSVNVYVHPKNVTMKGITEVTKKHERYLWVWMRALPKYCTC